MAIKTILKLNPFIFKVKKDFFRALYIDPSEIEDKVMFEKLIKHTHCDNIKGTLLYCFGNSDKIINWIHEHEEQYNNLQVLEYPVL